MGIPETPAPLQIRRKPVNAAPTARPSPCASPSLTFPDRESGVKLPPPPPRPDSGDRLRPEIQMPSRPVSRGAEPLLQVPHSHGLRTQKSMPELSRLAADSPPPSPFNAMPAAPAATFGPGVSDTKKNFMQTAFNEARHFAGGLVPHPTESTKHYTVLRHSPPLIFYRGPGTSIAITIFSSPDHPLPADRTLWLQQRGFSGDSGMKIKAFFHATDDWLHVTPAIQAQPHHVDAETERAWQRDIGKAAKKLLKEKGPKKAHIPRETHVVRIPEASDDGYFRLILCTGRGTPYSTGETSSRCKTLCTSPAFRVASASTDASVFRGAKLSTLPLEMGVFVGSLIATTVADTYIAPVRDPIEEVIERVRPGFVAETVGALVHDELSERSAEQDAERDEAFFAAHQAHITRALAANPNVIHPIGPDSGPEAPFPIKFKGKVVRGTGRSQAELGVPTANLSGVPDEIQYRLNGIYFGWACVQPKKTKETDKDRSQPNPIQNQPLTPTLPVSPLAFDPPPQSTFIDPPPEPEWHEAIISITPCPYSGPSVTPKPLVAINLLNQPPATDLLGATLKVLTLGLLRPAPSLLSLPSPAVSPLNQNPTQHQSQNQTQTQAQVLKERLDAASRDVCLTLVSLARENWTPDSSAVRAGLDERDEERGLGEKVGEAKDKFLGRVLPKGVVKAGAAVAGGMRRVGVRSGDGEERDRVRGVGGYWVAR